MLGASTLASIPLASFSSQAIPAKLGTLAGSYILSGQAVTLLLAKKVPADVGAYVLSGKDIEFVVSISQEAVFRVLLVGSSAQLISGFRMITNFRMVAGDNKTLVCFIKDSEGSAVSITGATFKWQCARSYGKTSDISKSSSDGISISDGPNGTLTITLDADDTEDLRGTFVHELQMTLNDIVSTPIKGTMKIDPALIEAT